MARARNMILSRNIKVRKGLFFVPHCVTCMTSTSGQTGNNPSFKNGIRAYFSVIIETCNLQILFWKTSLVTLTIRTLYWFTSKFVCSSNKMGQGLRWWASISGSGCQWMWKIYVVYLKLKFNSLFYSFVNTVMFKFHQGCGDEILTSCTCYQDKKSYTPALRALRSEWGLNEDWMWRWILFTPVFFDQVLYELLEQTWEKSFESRFLRADSWK